MLVRLKHLAEDAENAVMIKSPASSQSGLRDQMRKKLLGLQEFPKLEDAIKLCRSLGLQKGMMRLCQKFDG